MTLQWKWSSSIHLYATIIGLMPCHCGLMAGCLTQALRGKAESIRAGELEKALSKVGEGLTKKQMKAIEELSRSIVNKILHGPMTALRCDGSDPDAVGQTLANMEALERMFELARFEVPAAGRR